MIHNFSTDHVTKVLHRKNVLLSFVSFLFAIGWSIIDTVQSPFLNNVLGSEVSVGLFAGALTIISLISLVASTPLIEAFQERRLWVLASLGLILSFFLVSYFESAGLILVLLALATVFKSIERATYGIMFKDQTTSEDLGKNEGILYSLDNAGWMIGPLLAGILVTYASRQAMYGVAALFMILAVLFLRHIHTDTKSHAVQDTSWRESLRFFQDKRRVHTYILGGLKSAFFSFAYIYGPLILLHNGYGNHHISIMFFLLALAPLLFNYPAGQLADKFGAPRVLTLGYTLIFLGGFAALLSPPMYGPWLLPLCALGVGLISPVAETNYFRVVGENDEEWYGTYNTTYDVFSGVSRFGTAGILAFSGFQASYLVLVFVGSLGIYAGHSLTHDQLRAANGS